MNSICPSGFVLLRHVEANSRATVLGSDWLNAFLNAPPFSPPISYFKPEQVTLAELSVLSGHEADLPEHSLARSVQIASERAKIVEGLSDFIIFEFLECNKDRVHLVNSNGEVVRIFADDALSLLHHADGYDIDFDNPTVGRTSLLERAAERCSRLAFLDVTTWTISMSMYDQWGSMSDYQSTLHEIQSTLQYREGWEICIQMSSVPTLSELSRFLPDNSAQSRTHTMPTVSGNVSVIVRNTLAFLNVQTGNRTKQKSLWEEFARGTSRNWWKANVLPELAKEHGWLIKGGRRKKSPQS